MAKSLPSVSFLTNEIASQETQVEPLGNLWAPNEKELLVPTPHPPGPGKAQPSSNLACSASPQDPLSCLGQGLGVGLAIRVL